MNKNIVIFEVQGGSDKGEDGFRPDTMPIINALKTRGWNAQVIHYKDTEREKIKKKVINTADAYVSRINPGNIPGGESRYFDFLRSLIQADVIGMPHPDAMIGYGAKDALCKLIDTPLVPDDTYAYYSLDELKQKFPQSLASGERVLKQNRGSTGEGIWRIALIDKKACGKGTPITSDTKIRCTEAVDNHVEEWQLGEFMDFCKQYINGENGMLVDMPFMPRIKEGEIRILMVGSTPIFVVHKTPAETEDAFSATLFSGAKYTYDSPSKWQNLVDLFHKNLPMITERLGGYDIPLIWTADFMLDWDENHADKYVLGEINCSCVGFTSHLEHGIQERVAEEIISTVTAKRRQDELPS